MTKIHIFASPLHDSGSVMDTREYLKDEFARIEASDRPGSVCFIATGGTENAFKEALPSLEAPILILSDGYHNSFAASFEIVTYLERKGIAHEFVNYPLPESVELDTSASLKQSATEVPESPYSEPRVLEYLAASRIGLIGGASDWLIASDVDTKAVSARFGCRFIPIAISELEDEFRALGGKKDERIPDAERMCDALRNIVKRYELTALTVKCFDLLGTCGTTCCLALSRIGDEGIVCGCEGDIPALWTMMVGKALCGQVPFMANPSSSDPEALTVDFAHCTIPLGMTDRHSLPTHFESGISVGIAGILPLGRYSILKIGGPQLDRVNAVPGTVTANTRVSARCRTQLRFRFADRASFEKFTSARLGNHIVLIP